jgi:hypothetical protein
MSRTKSIRTLALAGFVSADKLSHSYRSLLPVLALCLASAAWSQYAPGFRGGSVQQGTPAPATPASAQYRFVSIAIPGSTGTYSFGINNAGVVTGSYNDASNNSNGFVWQNGTSHTLDSLGSVDTALQSVSNRGVAAGYYGDNTASHAAMYSLASSGWITLPDIPGLPNNLGWGINSYGVAVGYAGGGDSGFGYNPTNTVAWIWNPSTQTYSFFNVPEAAQYSSYADSINDKGQIVGTFFDTSGVAHGFVKEGATYTTIDVPGATGTYAYGNNNSGAIVGVWQNLSGWNEGFVRTSGGTVTVVDFPGALETEIGGINDRGDICGLWVDPNTGFWTGFVGFKK